MKHTIFESKFPGICSKCLKHYEVGTRILKGDDGKMIEADCYFGPKPFRNNASPKAAPSSLSPTARKTNDIDSQGAGQTVHAPNTALPAPKDFSIEENMDYAIKLVNGRLGGEDYSLYGSLISEIMRERHAIYMSKRIQEADEKKIKAFGKGN